MKCQFEHVAFPRGCSIRIYHRKKPSGTFEWHHHPVYELTLSLNSHGWRFIGDHIGRYHAHDLVLVPPDMPHTWVSIPEIDESSQPSAVVVWFTKDWPFRLAEVCPEFSSLRKLMARAGSGLRFSAQAGAKMEARLPELLSESPRTRLHAALELLCELADTEAVKLATELTATPKSRGESEQLARVLDLLHRRFMGPVRIQELCAAANLSPRSLRRLFLRHLGENFSHYLGGLRIGRACMLLAETERPIRAIAEASGYANLSNFNRRFRDARRMTPKEFRSFFVEYGRMPGCRAEMDLTQRSPSLEPRAKKTSPRAGAWRSPAAMVSAGQRAGFRISG